ncbi:carbohydrate porin [Novosphingobium sp. P6W]|uniref:carbohydrate porin n=1 Tax=Novosphingobium sp. P6W TaxID=1609758 RepID=UPI000697605D|nr:carbohydrate porin [Novosphingobium sp. P6W]AXB78500.1 carbohydrate porin [Novosphingobium sp. P6W]
MKYPGPILALLIGGIPFAAAAQTVNYAADQPVTTAAASPEASPPPAAEPRQPASAQPLDSVKQQPLFGNWGLRKRLAADGVTLNARWVVEPAVNTRGYRGSGLNVVSHLNVGADLDLGKLGIVDHGTVRVIVTDRLGDSTNSARTGAYIQNQAFYGQGKDVRFNELSYEQTFLDSRLSVKAGFYSMGNDFGKLPYTCNFTNNGNCGHPLGPVYSSGWRDDPTGQWGGRIKWSDRSGWYVQAGAYDVATDRNQVGHGFDFGFSGTKGAFFPVEAGYVHGRTPSDYAGTYKITAYYETSRAALQDDAARTKKGRSGAIIQAAQQIWKPTPDTVRGISVFGVATIADKDTGLIPAYYELGSSWRGPLASRPDDILSLSWTKAKINSRLARVEEMDGDEVQTSEELWELNYGTQVAPWLLVRPGIQYVVRPGGYDSRPNTVVFVWHFQATL